MAQSQSRPAASRAEQGQLLNRISVPTRRVVAGGAVFATAGAATALINRLTLPRLTPGPAVVEPVVVVVPARDEASRIGDIVSDLRRQRGVARLQIVIVDDASSDGTAAVARRAAGDDARITVLRTTEAPPPGWTGKAAACARGFDSTAGYGGSPVPHTHPEPPAGVVVFVDADVRLEPDAVAAAAALLRSEDAALVSPWPYQVTGSISERLMQPLLFWSWFSVLPIPVAHRTGQPSMAVACGQFLVFDAASYVAAGGHASVASSPTEDLDLARTLRRAGYRTVVAAAGPLASCRMYAGARPLAGGYTRWLWSAFGSVGGAAAVVAAYTAGYVLPPVAVLAGRGPTRRWGVLGTGAAVASRILARSAERGGRPRPEDVVAGFTQPAAIAGFSGLTIRSVWARRAGRTAWKDRLLP